MFLFNAIKGWSEVWSRFWPLQACCKLFFNFASITASWIWLRIFVIVLINLTSFCGFLLRLSINFEISLSTWSILTISTEMVFAILNLLRSLSIWTLLTVIERSGASKATAVVTTLYIYWIANNLSKSKLLLCQVSIKWKQFMPSQFQMELLGETKNLSPMSKKLTKT